MLTYAPRVFEQELIRLQTDANEIRTLAGEIPDPILRLRLVALAEDKERDIRRMQRCKAA